MDVTDAVTGRIEVREYAERPADAATKRAILDAGRLSPSGRNLQHWRFVLVDDPPALRALADASPTGCWVADAAFAVAVCTDPTYPFNEIDAGRASASMQRYAWGVGVGSRLSTVDTDEARHLLGVPDDYDRTAVLGFGYPTFDVASVRGLKDRRALDDVAFRGRFGEPLSLEA